MQFLTNFPIQKLIINFTLLSLLIKFSTIANAQSNKHHHHPFSRNCAKTLSNSHFVLVSFNSEKSHNLPDPTTYYSRVENYLFGRSS